ncbi:MAG: FmdE family protein [Candidatus Scalindua sp.]|nr:FmdE family protein [Candidatus Scalindua sp.]
MSEGQTKFNKAFFDEVEPIKLKDPLAVALGAMDKDEPFVYKYGDAVKIAGHSCPAVSGAYRMTQIALKKLYGNDTPVRGEIKVTFRGEIEYKVNGPISQVVTFITGAAAENGFHGLGGGKFNRFNLLTFNGESQPPAGAVCSAIFTRTDNGKSVEVTYSNSMLPANPKMGELMPLAVSGTGSKEEIDEFGNLWHERIKMVLMGNVEGMFVVKEGA